MTAGRRTLHAILHQANVRMVTLGMVSAWLAITVIAYVNLRIYGDQNLMLIANSVAYATEAAVVFRDRQAAGGTLSEIAEREHLAAARILDVHRDTMARFDASPGGPLDRTLRHLADALFPSSADAEIHLEDGSVVGQVTVRGDSLPYLHFFATTLLAAVACLGLLTLVVARLARRVEREITRPLDQLASLTHAVRMGRQFNLRAPPSHVVEIDGLGEDIGALLGDIERLEREREKHTEELERANAQLEHQNRHDFLTGLANRWHFHEALADHLAAVHHRREHFAVLYVDYDRFKAVNDQYGHGVGDQVLIETARRITGLLGEHDLAARLGGDEFAVLLTGPQTEDTARAAAERIVAAMREPVILANVEPIEASVSVGVALFPDHAPTLETLLEAADAAMYRAKLHQRTGVALAPAVPETEAGS